MALASFLQGTVGEKGSEGTAGNDGARVSLKHLPNHEQDSSVLDLSELFGSRESTD